MAIANDVLKSRIVLLFFYLSNHPWKKIIYQLTKQLKINEINQRLKLRARVPIAVSSCSTAASMYSLNFSPFSSLYLQKQKQKQKHKKYKSKGKESQKYPIIVYFLIFVCRQDLRTYQCSSAVKFRIYRLAKCLTLIQTGYSQFLSSLCTYL